MKVLPNVSVSRVLCPDCRRPSQCRHWKFPCFGVHAGNNWYFPLGVDGLMQWKWPTPENKVTQVKRELSFWAGVLGVTDWKDAARQVFWYDAEKPADSPSREEEYRAYHTR